MSKITAETFTNIMNESKPKTTVIEWNGAEIEIKYSLSLGEALTFINASVNACFTDDSDEYIPEGGIFAMKSCVLELYANFELPQDIELRYDLIYNTDAFDRVVEHINMRQLNEMVDAIDEKKEYIRQTKMSDVKKQAEEVIANLGTLQEQLSAVFGNVSEEDISTLLQAVSGNKIDERSLVEAYIGATTKK